MEIILSFPNMEIVWIPGVENIMSDKLSRLFPKPQDTVILDKTEKALFPQIYKPSNHKNLKRKKMVQKADGTRTDVESGNLNDQMDPPIHQFYNSLEDNQKDLPHAEHFIKIKRWTFKTIHEIMDEQIIESDPIEPTVQINYIQNMDESHITPPESEREDILKQAHEFGHFGAEALVKHIRTDEGMNWPNMIKDALEIVKRCPICQKFAITNRGYNPMKPLYCYTPGWHYQMDLCGPFPCTSNQNTYIMVLLDVATRFVILRPIVDKSAKTVAKELISIFSLMGYPRIINSDRGTEWKNQILDLVCEAMKIDKRLSTAYYAQSNGGAERAVQNTKRLLSKLILGNSEDDWDMTVNTVQLMINCKVSKRLQTSPFNLMFARKMSNAYPLFADPDDGIAPMSNDELLKRAEYMSDIVFPAIKERTDLYNKMMADQFNKKHRLVNFPVGSFVVVRKKGIKKSLAPVYEGPYEVMRKTEGNNYTLRDEIGLIMPRDFTPSELKLVSQDAVIAQDDVYEFDAIVNHRGEPGEREYLIRWKNYTSKEDSWITADMFTDPQAVINYWKRVNGSINKKDSKQMNNLFPKESSLPSFKPNKQGKLLKAVLDVPEVPETKARKPRQKQHIYKKTSHQTKAVPITPAQKAFRRSPRPQRFDPAMDNTKFRK
jgi:hypothetical protein